MRTRAKLYRCSATSLPGAGCAIQMATGYTVRTGLPRRMGGDDTAPQPVELLVAALLGCKTATAHYVARHAWPKPDNMIESVAFLDVVACRDENGALALPIAEPNPVPAGLTYVAGTAVVIPRATGVQNADVQALGRLVEQRCPVAATLRAGGCQLDFVWTLGSRSLSAS